MSSIKKLFIIILVLFSISGALKWIPFFTDITVFLGVLTIGFTILNIINFDFGKLRVFDFTIAIFLLFHIFYFLSSIYTLSDNYYKDKIVKVILNIFIFIAPIILLKDKSNFNFLSKTMLFLHFILTIILILNYYDNKFDLLFYDYENSVIRIPSYQVISNILVVYILFNINTKGLINLINLSLSIIFLLLLSSRAAILFMVLFFIKRMVSIKKVSLRKNLLILVSILLPLIIFRDIIFDKISKRLYFGSDFLNDASGQGRIDLIQKAINQFYENPIFGVGIASFGILEEGIDDRLAPHNIFLEVFMETGIIGGFLFLLIFIFLFAQIKISNIMNDSNLRVFVSILIFSLFIDIISGFFEDMRMTYFALGLLMSYVIFIKYEFKKQTN